MVSSECLPAHPSPSLIWGALWFPGGQTQPFTGCGHWARRAEGQPVSPQTPNPAPRPGLCPQPPLLDARLSSSWGPPLVFQMRTAVISSFTTVERIQTSHRCPPSSGGPPPGRSEFTRALSLKRKHSGALTGSGHRLHRPSFRLLGANMHIHKQKSVVWNADSPPGPLWVTAVPDPTCPSLSWWDQGRAVPARMGAELGQQPRSEPSWGTFPPAPYSFLKIIHLSLRHWLLRWLSGKESICKSRRHRRHGLDPWVRKIPWKRTQQPTPVFLRGESHGQRSLVGYSP